MSLQFFTLEFCQLRILEFQQAVYLLSGVPVVCYPKHSHILKEIHCSHFHVRDVQAESRLKIGNQFLSARWCD
jgi:hypothetical protein